MIDCLIVGAGPAGLSAAIYLRRFHRSVCIVDNNQSRARKIDRARNFPGFPAGINGDAFLALLRTQFGNFGGTVSCGTVTDLRKDAEGNFATELDGNTVTSKTVLLAAGVVDIEPDLAGYENLKATGLVRFCPICDGFEHTHQRVGVIGSGVHGMHECEFIRNYSGRVTLISLKPPAIESPPVLRELDRFAIPVLDAHGGTLRHQENSATVLLELSDGSSHEFDILYCALGCNVRSSLAITLGADHDEQRCLKVDAHLETTVRGLYAAGDVVSGLHQLAVAAGHAATAATAIHNRLREM